MFRFLMKCGLMMLMGMTLLRAQGSPTGDDFSLSLGLGVLDNTDVFRDIDNQTFPIPLIELQYKRFYVRGVNLGVTLLNNETFTLNLGVRPEFNNLEEDDDPFYEGIQDRELSVMTGLGLKINLGNRYNMELTAETDVIGNSEGFLGGVSFSRTFVRGRGKTIFIPGLRLVYADLDFNNYYYGITEAEARIDRPAYVADSDFNIQLNMMLRHTFSDKLTGVVLFGAERMGGEITDSPIVDKDNGLIAVFGLTWNLR